MENDINKPATIEIKLAAIEVYKWVKKGGSTAAIATIGPFATLIGGIFGVYVSTGIAALFCLCGIVLLGQFYKQQKYLEKEYIKK